MFDQKQQRNINLWTRLFDDIQDEESLCIFEGNRQEQHNQIVQQRNPLIPIEEFFGDFIIKDSNPHLQKIPFDVTKKNVYLKQKTLSQDKNTPKAMMRMFLGYHLQVSGDQKTFPRAIDIEQAYGEYCQSIQENIKLSFYKYVFNQSPYRKRNRQIFYQILSNNKIIEKQVLNNGNVQCKGKYIYAIKVMKLRCRKGILCERAQTR